MKHFYNIKNIPVAVLATIAPAIPVGAITWGEFDASNDYPSDGTMMLDWIERDRPQWGYSPGCSGVLVHPKVFLTAAHCIVGSIFFDDDGYPLDRPLPDRDEDAPDSAFGGPGVWVSFENDPADYDPVEEKCESCLDVERALVNPNYAYNSNGKGDVAALILTEEYGAAPAQLPGLGYFDELPWHDLKDAPIINVGYGGSFDEISKKQHDTEYLDLRQFSISTVKSLGQEYIGLNMHANQGNGGTCYGDSGGSGYYTDKNNNLILAGLTSWGDSNCISTDRIVRVDIPDNHDFVECILTEAEGSEEYNNCM